MARFGPLCNRSLIGSTIVRGVANSSGEVALVEIFVDDLIVLIV